MMTSTDFNFQSQKNTMAAQDFAAKSREYVLQTTAGLFTSDWLTRQDNW
jgi:hypothetical protein